MKNLYAFSSKVCLVLLTVFFCSHSNAQPPNITYTTVLSGFTAPTNVNNAGDGSNRLFIVQQNGVIMVKDGATLTQFGDFGNSSGSGANIISISNERGLLSMEFHPQYNGTTNRYFFIYYTDLGGNIAVSRFQTQLANRNLADLSTLLNIITIPHPGENNHNGGQIRFGSDGYLYFATGDGGGGNDPNNNAQNGDVLLGKMLRLDIDQTSGLGNYAVPPGNPYVNDPGNLIDDRVFNLGLRNPYRFSFDRLTGDLWIGDVGQGAWEEIDYRPAANAGHNNFGWRCYEGYVSTPGVADCNPVDYVRPVRTYPNPNSGSSSVNGGFVYRGTEFPTLYGRYIATDVYSGDIFMLWPNGSGGFDSSVQISNPLNFVVGYGEAEDGTLYAVSQADNTLYKVVATGGVVVPVALKSFKGLANNGYNNLQWQTAFEQNTARFHIEYSRDGSLFTRAGSVAATRNANGSSYDFRHYTDNKTDIFYRLAIENDNGSVAYSSIIKLNGTRNNIRIYPTVISNNILNLDLNNKSLTAIKIINGNGMLVFKKDVSDVSSTMNIPLPALAKGLYIVELKGDGVLQRERIIIQ